MHPYETLFVKESWHAGEPHLSRYTKWKKAHLSGHFGTEGTFDEELYKYALCNEGLKPKDTQEMYRQKNLTCTQ